MFRLQAWLLLVLVAYLLLRQGQGRLHMRLQLIHWEYTPRIENFTSKISKGLDTFYFLRSILFAHFSIPFWFIFSPDPTIEVKKIRGNYFLFWHYNYSLTTYFVRREQFIWILLKCFPFTCIIMELFYNSLVMVAACFHKLSSFVSFHTTVFPWARKFSILYHYIWIIKTSLQLRF